MKISVLFCGLLVAAVSAGSSAFAATTPGLWNYNLRIQMPGMPAITPEMMAQMQAMGIKLPGMGGAPITT